MQYISKSHNETQKIGSEFAQSLLKEAANGFILIGLEGDLGAGKTTFVQGMAAGLGMNPEYYVSSPTFTLINEYPAAKIDLIHVDLYRIERARDTETLGLEEYMKPRRIMVVEWIERSPELVSAMSYRICLKKTDENERMIEIQPLAR